MAELSLIYRHRSREYWLVWDASAQVFEMFASKEADDYLGCFDTRAEALAYAKQHALEA
jgi:hypothetical protein